MERRVPGFAATFFLHHHVARFVETKFNNAIGPWFYPVVFLAGTVPWTASAAIVAWRRNRQGTLAVGPAGWSPSIRLALVWFVTVMVFFSIPRSKLAGYILPALPAFALLLGPVVAHVFDRALAAAVALALCCALAVASPLILKPTPDTLVLSIAREIRDEDRLIFFNRHFHSTAYRLARTSVIPIAGRWEFPAASFPDNQYRELIEGAEAMGADYKSILLDEAALRDTIARPGVTWIVTEQVYLAHLQNLGAKDIAAQNKGFAVLRVAR